MIRRSRAAHAWACAASAAAAYAASTAAFEVWFKATVLDLSGSDPNTQPLGPVTLEVFSWEELPGRGA